MGKKVKTLTHKSFLVMLTLIMLFGALPRGVFADEVNHSSGGGTIIPPIVSTNLIGNQSAIFVDFSVWEMEIDNIGVEAAPDYVLPFITDDAAVLIFPEDVAPTTSHSFLLSTAIQGVDYPLLVGLNGLGQITEMSEFPSNSTETAPPNIPPAPPNLDENWFLDGGVINGNLPVTDDGNPDNVPTLQNPQGRLEVWGGEAFWDNELEVWNFPQNTLVIRKENQVTGQLLPGARFSVTRVSSGNDSGLHGTVIGEFDTNSSGIIVIAGLDPGFYIVEELIPPTNFTLDTNTRQHVFMRPDDTSVVSVTFSNLPYGSMVITLRDSVTSAPIPNGEFRVTTSNGAVVGTNNGIFWTNLQGEILIPNMRPDSYVITQVSVPPTHVINLVQSTQTLRVNATGEIYRVDFFSDPLSQLLITLRSSENGQPLQGGEFRVTNSAGHIVGSSNGIFFTNAQGEIVIPGLTTDSYVVTQINPAPGHRLGDSNQNSQTIFISRPSETYSLDFVNVPYRGIIITSLDAYNGDPLPGVRYSVRQIDGTFVGEFTSDQNGRIEIIPSEGFELLGWFEITQIYVPNGWAYDAQPQRSVQVTTQNNAHLTFNMPRMGSLEIVLQDEDGNPLPGGRFEVRHQNGQLVGEFTTNQSGGISLPNLGSGWFTVEQIAPPSGFVMTDTTRSVEVTTNTVARAVFTNIQSPDLVIEKVDTDGNPLAGAEFEVRTLSGELIHRGITSNGGIIAIPMLAPGAYTITETRAPDGFVITEPSRTIQIVAGQTLTERFVNHRQPSLIIEKVDTDGNPLAGAEFEVRTLGGNLEHRGVTNQGGMIAIEHLAPGAYQVIETRAPDGFVITEPSRTIQVVAGQTLTERFVNHRQPSLIIEKVDTDGNPLAGAEFEVRTLGGNLEHRGVTNQGGMITIEHLDPGAYQVIETRAPDGFVITEPSRAIQVVAGQTLTERFVNHRQPSLIIEKVDTDGNPLAGATFEVRTLAGLLVERLVTNQGGMAIIYELAPGSYEVIETIAPDGFALVEGSRAIQITAGQTITERFVNPRLSTLVIQKLHAITSEPLPGVRFEITTLQGQQIPNPINNSFEFVTDNAGMIRLPNIAAGSYVITETQPLPGFMAADPVVWVVGHDNEYLVTIRNYPYPAYNILKLDGHTLEPLAGVQFEIAPFFGGGSGVTSGILAGQIGERLRNPADGSFTWTTDAAGLIRIPNLEHGTYVAIETRPLPGFRSAEPRIFTVDNFSPTTITIHNYRYAEWNILKLDGHTNSPQAGVIFEVSSFWGSPTAGGLTGTNAGERIRNPLTGSFEFVSNASGIASLGALEPGTYIITETHPLPGFVASEPVVFTVGEGDQNTTITIRNYRQAELTIRKINSVTRQPLAGVHFEISRPDGTRLINTQTGGTDFITDSRGLIFLPTIEDGRFYLHETRALPGFTIDQPIIPFNINAQSRQQEHVLTVENSPASGLLIVKTDASNGQPLAGVEFEVRRADGGIVSGQQLDGNQPDTFANSPQLAANGRFVTDANGRINLNNLPPGVYHVTETRALQGFELDTTVHVVTVVPGEQAVLEVVNRPLGGVRLLKIDAFTREPIFNVEFMVFDSNNQVVGVFYTDNNGLIDFGGLLVEGRYTIRETRPAPGYFGDDMPRTIEIVAGQVTEIVWENIPMAGQLQIEKISGDFNEVNGLPPGTPLEGAVFEIFDERTGNLVDRIRSDHRGMAVSRPLPLGRYFAVEVQAPAFYMINPTPLHFNIEFATQIVRATFPNFSANIGVSINKVGPQEAMQGHEISYEIRNIRNESSVPLSDFFWRDIIPTEAIRAERLVTGTFNHSLRFSIHGITNTGNEFVIADNILSTRAEVINLSAPHLGLAHGEYLAEFSVIFGQVPAGFMSVEPPRLFASTLSSGQANLPDGMVFVNRVDVGGRHGEEWVISNSTWGTTLFVPRGTLPRSGW